jgi:hypothetical protein
MAATDVTLLDLARDPGEVARGLLTWQRGDPDEAAVQTLKAVAGQLHARSHTIWVWSGRAPDDSAGWVLPIPARTTEAFAPRGPARALLRCIDAAVLGGADPERVHFISWHGLTGLIGPGMDPEFAAYALSELYPAPSRAAVAGLPADVRLSGPAIPLTFIPPPGRSGIEALGHMLAVHPVRVALTLAAHGQPAAGEEYPPELVDALREWGCIGHRPPEPVVQASLEIADDPCPRRRHARKVLQRLLRMGKVGAGYHTEFDHLYRGAAPDERQQALEVGETLLRAGLLGEKPSVGQRHVYLRREALRDIHALIERGESSSELLRAFWTAPAPRAAGR